MYPMRQSNGCENSITESLFIFAVIPNFMLETLIISVGSTRYVTGIEPIVPEKPGNHRNTVPLEYSPLGFPNQHLNGMPNCSFAPKESGMSAGIPVGANRAK